MAVGLAFELHKDKVPDLNDMRIVLVHEGAARYAAGPLLWSTYVYVDLGARAAGTGVSHFPEVVVLVAQDDVVLGKVLEPLSPGLLVHRGTILRAAFENRGIELVPVYLIDLCEQFPGPVYGLVLEIVPEAPVSEHLEHGVVIGVVSHFLEVVVLSAHAEALLRVRGPVEFCLCISQEDVLELVHSGVGEHQGRVILYDHRSRWHHRVALRGEKIQECLADFFGCHILFNYIRKIYKPANLRFF